MHNSIVPAQCRPLLRGHIDVYYRRDQNGDSPRIVKGQQSLFNMINLQSMSGAPWFTRNMSSFLSVAALERDLSAFSAQRSPSAKLQSAINSVKQAWEYTLYEYAIDNCHNVEGSNPQLEIGQLRENYINDLKTKAAALQIGEMLLVPIGYYDHAVFLELTCTNDNGERTFNAKVYDSGRDTFWLQLNPFARIPTQRFGNIREQSPLNNRLYSSD